MADQLTVGFDITSVLYNRGVSRYTSNMVRALAALDEGPTLRLFGSSFRANRQLKTMTKNLQTESGITTKPNILSFPPAFLSRMWYQVGRLHIESLMPKVDVFHAWEELIPPSYKTPVVATIHDLAIFKFPELAHPQTKERHTLALKRLSQYGSHVIAVSQQTRTDLIELFSFAPDHVHVVPEAVPLESIVSKTDLLSKEDLEERFGIKRPFFLWVGINEPRKNLSRMMDAWRSFSTEYDLVLVGSSGLQSLKPEQGVKVISGASRQDLASLYFHATLLLFASLYEGFGLPILEAFYYQCPVITSNNSSMLEVGDDAAFLVDPYEVESIQGGMKDAIAKGKSAARQKLMKKQVDRFSWEKSARMTLDVYKAAKAEGKLAK
ncbi:hypothetical protein C5B42_02370 [Candidatus Cerribacteria bacterium 'Amazon FNV 2010 28 9']|uniref:Glycosyltransferase family 1 protein n=1 Tax=Candidatus Cerribacteria bacterium 'Amazon FNV 2010 28 9' TaxID=2081795 RepID=A0A317JP42_9BACT|nr:MAG: hypothetical protein C5B42_02370 [Candidatus Cerribacteria bacterium 'Amazon FNV 2010 28 9']